MHFQSIRFDAPRPGPALIVTGAVHGNEVCGTQAIRRIVAEFETGRLALQCGRVTFVPITNPMAYALGRRAGDRNLNRKLAPTPTPQQFEDHVANWLCPLLAQHDVLLDLHSFQAGGQPFVMVGPQDNNGVLEPTRHAAKEEALAQRLGVRRAVDGWLATYARGVEHRQAFAAAHPGAPVDLDPRYGIGTTEYMRSQGGWALTLECGQHADPEAPQVAYDAIHHTLAHLGLIDAPDPAPMPHMESLHLHEVIDKQHADDSFARGWTSFDRLRAGDLIGTRADGTEVRAPEDGHIVFPNPKANAGQEWFYLAAPSTRFANGGSGAASR